LIDKQGKPVWRYSNLHGEATEWLRDHRFKLSSNHLHMAPSHIYLVCPVVDASVPRMESPVPEHSLLGHLKAAAATSLVQITHTARLDLLI
jgi:hypothetical protein